MTVPQDQSELERDAMLHVRRLWRGQGTTAPTPRRGPRQRLDLEAVLSAAIRIADTHGLAAVSMRAVAAEVRTTAMSLYAYVGSKEDLISLIQDTALGHPTARDAADPVTGWADAFFTQHLRHPWLCDINWADSSAGPNERAWLEALARDLAELRIDPRDRAPLVTALYSLVRACAQTYTAQLRPEVRHRWVARARQTHELLGDLAGGYPSTVELTAAQDHGNDPAESLRRGVQLLLRGARAVTPSASGRRGPVGDAGGG